MNRLGVGITLQPEARYLELLQPVFADDADYLVIAPETCWYADEEGVRHHNSYRRWFLGIGDRTQKPFVAHAVGASLGTADPKDLPRQQAWLQRLATDQRAFAFQWCTDHLGAGILDGRAITLPVALPMTAAAAELVADRLAAMQHIVPDVGFENTVCYFLLGDWLDEPRFFDAILCRPRTHLLLDLHNVFTMAKNVGANAREWLARVDCTRVIEIHLAGGRDSDPQWLPSRRTLRLDGHDDAIPEDVWKLYEEVLPRCTNLRGVTLERMEGTVGENDVAPLRDELRRAREVLRACR